jgi:hypothetical protein
MALLPAADTLRQLNIHAVPPAAMLNRFSIKQKPSAVSR